MDGQIDDNFWDIYAPKTKSADVTHLLDAMRGGTREQESSNGKNIKNARTGATGDFQVLPENVPRWTKKYLNREMSVEEFTKDLDAQIQVFNGEMGEYLQAAKEKGVDDDTAIRMGAAGWYGGKGAMHRFDDDWRPRPNEPSFKEYTLGVLGKSKKFNKSQPEEASIWDFNFPNINQVAENIGFWDLPNTNETVQPEINSIDALPTGFSLTPDPNYYKEQGIYKKPSSNESPIPPKSVPESNYTIAQQIESSMRDDSPRSAVLLTEPKQLETIPLEQRKSFTPVATPNGTVLVANSKAAKLGLHDPLSIIRYVNKNGFASLIGKVEDVGNATGDGMTVRTEDLHGNELSSSIVTNPDAAQAQIDLDRAEFGEKAVSSVLPTSDAIARREQETAQPLYLETEKGLKLLQSSNQANLQPGEIRIRDTENDKGGNYIAVKAEGGYVIRPEITPQIDGAAAPQGNRRKGENQPGSIKDPQFSVSIETSGEFIPVDEKGKPIPTPTRSTVAFTSPQDAPKIAERNLVATSGLSEGSRVYREKPTAKQVTADAVRSVYGDNAFAAEEAYRKLTGKTLFQGFDEDWIQKDIDENWNPKSGVYDNVRGQIAPGVQKLVAAYDAGGEEGLRRELALQGNLASADFSASRERAAEERVKAEKQDEIINPSVGTSIEKVIGNLLGLNPAEIAKMTAGSITGKNSKSIGDIITKADNDTAQIKREYGSFEEYERVKKYAAEMSAPEAASRYFAGYMRGVVNTAISSNLKGIDVVDKLIEKVSELNPVYNAIPEKFRPTLRTVENGIGYTIASLLGKGDKFAAAKSDSDVDRRLFYNIGKNLEESLGNEKYLKDGLAYKLSESLGSATGFLLLGLIAPEASIGQGLKTFSLTSGGFGALGQAGSMYSDAKGKGLSEAKSLTAGAIGLPLGASEGFGVGAALNKALNTAERKSLTKFIAEFIAEGGEEAGQETFQGTGQDVAFQLLEDKDPSLAAKVKNVLSSLPNTVAKNILDGGLTAFITGGLFSKGVEAASYIAQKGAGIKETGFEDAEDLPGAPEAVNNQSPEPAKSVSIAPEENSPAGDTSADFPASDENQKPATRRAAPTVQGIKLTPRNPESNTDAAHEAQTSPHNDLPEPSQAQIEAGNYKKGHIRVAGLDITVENPVGSQRTGVDRDGKAWAVDMFHHYGYIKRSVGADTENIDIFVKDHTPEDFAGNAYIVDQVHPDDGSFDEHKVMLGFSSEAEARKAYQSNYAADWKGLKSITAMPMDEFKKWTKETQVKPAAQSGDLTKKDAEIKSFFEPDGQKNSYSRDLRDKQWQQVLNGETKEAGGTSNLLIAAKAVRGRGGLQTSEEFERFTDDYMKTVANKKGADLQVAGNELLKRWEPKTDTPEQKPDREFSSTQVNLPKKEAAKILFAGRKLIKDADLAENGRETEPHTTVTFGLKTNDETEVREILKNVAPFELTLDKVSYFPPSPSSDGADVVKVDVEKTPELLAVHNLIKDSLDNEQSFPDYVPHVTLAYVKEGLGKKYAGDESLKGIKIPVTSIAFSSKDRRMIEIPLTGATKADSSAQNLPVSARNEPKSEISTPIGKELKTLNEGEEFRVKGQKYKVTKIWDDGVVYVNPSGSTRQSSSFNQDELNAAGFRTEVKPAENEAVAEAQNSTTDYGSANKVFTKDAADKARDVLRQKLRGLEQRTGIDPEILIAGMQLAGFHIEAGARKFTEYAKAMTEDLGGGIKPYLKSFYLSVKAYPGFDAANMDAENDIDSLLAEMEKEQVSPVSAQSSNETEQEKSLQSDENGSITKNNADVRNTQRNDQGRDEVESSDAAQGTPAKRRAGEIRGNESGSGDGDLSGTSRNSSERIGDVESSSAREDSAADSGEQSGEGNSDRPSDGIPAGNRDDGRLDYVAPVGSLARAGSWRETAKRNLDILELVKKLEAENRLATAEEQALLSKFTGWGASEIANNLFPGVAWRGEIDLNYAKDGWKDLAQRAKNLFTPEELKTAARSTQYAHYTSESIIRGIWDAFTQFGFSSGKILEPGMGVGLFASAAPESVMKTSRYTGIEMDAMTARIAKQILQKQAVLENDFVKQKLPENFFDIAIGNPPFSDTKILNDPKYKKYRFMLHDYFFAKSIDSVRPGGLLVFVTSKGTMDKGETKMREYIAERADLLGAIRLPQTAFKENAGTEVVTDVIFLRKRNDGETPAGEAWIERAEIKANNKHGEEQTGLINEYFVNNPEMVLGENSFQGSMYRANEYTVKPKEGDIEELFREAIAKLPAGVYASQARTEQIVQKTSERDWDAKEVKEGSLYIHADGRLMQKQFGAGVPLAESAKLAQSEEKWLKTYVALRTSLKEAQSDQLKDSPDWEKSLAELNRVYDDFVKKHGHILDFSTFEKTSVDEDGTEKTTVYKRYRNNKVLAFDVESPLVAALESINEDGKIVKSPMLLGRTIKPPQKPEIKELSDALAVSLDQVGGLNLAHVTELIQTARKGMTRDEVISELGEAIYETPTGEWQLADEYLSGFVVDKLEEAQAAANTDKKFERNVEALLKVQPAPLDYVDISANLGAAWIGANVVSDFAREIVGLRGNAVTFEPLTNTWTVDGAQGKGSQGLRDASNDWGTSDRSPNEILDAALNSKSTKITWRDDKGKTHTDADASALANEKVSKMREAFKKWIWTDAARARTIAEKYNRQFNNIAPRFFDGSHLSTPGLSSRYKLHPHQKRAVWRVLQTGNTYLAHAVGAGKTLEMIVSGMEQKRLGKISKPMYVVPNHMLKQFSSEFLEAYPLANILVADEQNFAKEKRQRFTAQAALNDLDAVVITHSAFGLIRTRPETADVVISELVEQMRMAIEDLDASDTAQKRTIKDLESRIEKIEQKFGSVMDATGKDDVINFEDLGVDFVYVDEAHEFRKLDFVTNRANVKGIDPKGSQRSLDLLIKLRWLDSQRPGRSAVLASGTPITNTMAELYSIMRYLDPAELEDAEMAHFDAWSAQFGEVVADYEMNAAGNYEIVERFSRFINIPELMKRARKFMDVLTLKQLANLINVPTIKGGSPEIVVVPATDEQKDYLMNVLAERIEISRKWKPSKDQPGNPDPLINIITDGRLAAIDMRFVNPKSENDPDSKLNRMIDKIIEKYREGENKEYRNKFTGEADAIKGAAQIVFSAVGFGEQIAASRGFDAKDWIIRRLTMAGIPRAEIAFMGDYKTATAKERMFSDMRQGKITLLFGSPKNMGTGVNVQKRLWVEHYLSPPWYPADVEQPDGRIIRQGNQNEEIEIYRYATKGTYDSTAWAMIARKSRAIEQSMTGDDSQRNLEDISESSQYEMASAVSAGDDRAIKLAGLRRDIEKLERLRGAHHQEQRQLGLDRSRADRIIKAETEDIDRYKAAIEAVGSFSVSSDAFNVTVGSQNTDKRAVIGDLLKKQWISEIKQNQEKAEKSKKDVDVQIGKALGKFPIIAGIYYKNGTVQSTLRLKIEGVAYDLTNNSRDGLLIDEIAEIDPVGFATRVFNGLNSLSKSKLESEREIETQKRKLKQIDSKVGQPFADEQELYEKIAEYAQLQKEMAGEGSADNSSETVDFLTQLSRDNASNAIRRVIANYTGNNPFIPGTLKQIADSAEGRRTLEQIKQLQFANFDELLSQAAIETFGDKIQANAESHEIYRRSFEEARIRANQTRFGAKDSEDIFSGIFLRPDTIKQTAEILREKAEEAKKLGYSPEEIAVFKTHAGALETAAKNSNGTAIVYVFDEALPEEVFHQADYLGAAEKSILNRHSESFANKLDAHPIAGIMWRKKYSRLNEYKRLSGPVLKAVVRMEIAPFLAETSVEDLAKLGISEKMRDDYLLTWFEGYADKNGIDALDNFEREELNVQRFIEKVKSATGEQVRFNGEQNEKGSAAEGKPSGETRAGPGNRQRGESETGDRRESGNVKSELDISSDTREFLELERGQKLASLPATMRRAGIEAADIAYEVFGDKAARESALRILAANDIEGSINILRAVNSPDADHAVLSFMLQRILFDNAAEVEATNPQSAKEFRELALELGREHALKAVRAGRFTRAASIIQNSVEGVIYTAQSIVWEKFGQDKSLSAEDLTRLQAVARESEEAVARATQLAKDLKNLQRKVKRLEEEKEGRRKKRRSGDSLARRKKVVELIRKKHAGSLDEIRMRLLEQFAPATAKSIIGEFAELTDKQTESLKEAYRLEKGQKSPEEIYAATGWERGSDGKFRHDLGEDISINHRVLRETLLSGKQAKLAEVLNAPELFAAYPQIAEVGVVFERMGAKDNAYFDLDAKVIALNSQMKWTRALGLTMRRGGGLTQDLIHETQHAIQQIEGFTMGTESTVSGWDYYWNNPGEVEARNAASRIELSRAERKKLPLSATEDVSRFEQSNWLAEYEPATLKRILDDGSFDDETLNDFAEVGAMILTEGLASETEFLPDDFHAAMTATFGDVIGSNFQEIYRRALKKRNDWLAELRYEKTRERIQEKHDEELSDEQIEEILGEQKEKAGRRRAIEKIHEIAAETKSQIKDAKELKRLIEELAKTDDAAVAAWLMAQKFDINQIYRELDKQKITGSSRQRQAVRDGSTVYQEAKKRILDDKSRILDEIAATQKEMNNIRDRQWKARDDIRRAGMSVQTELRRIQNGEFSYYVSQGANALNVLRTLMASADLSGSLRQGGFFTFAKPEAQKQAFVNMFKSFAEKPYGRAIQDIEGHKHFTLAQRSGLDFAEAGGVETGAMGEELYRGKTALEKIPVLGFLTDKLLTGWSERTYTSFLDTQRMVMFDIFATDLLGKGLTFEKNRNEFEKIAEFINVATGRGAVPKAKLAKLLMELPFFAPRYTLSRIQLLNMTLNPVAYYNMPPHTRIIVGKAAARFYGTTAAIMSPLWLLAMVSLDPEDDEFLKITVGNTKYDIFAGELQPAKAIIKVLQSAYNTKLGQDERIQGEFWYDVADLDKGAIPRFIRGKLSPVASLIWDAAKGSDFVGNEFSWGKALVSRIVPLLLSDLYNAYQLDGGAGVAKTLPSFFGIGASTYPAREGKPVTAAEKLAAKAMAMKMKSKPRTEEEAARQKLVAELTHKMRQGNDVAAEATALVSSGKLEKDDVKKIMERGATTLLEDKAEGLSLEEFEAVFRISNKEEKERLMPLLNKKMKNAEKDDKLSSAQRSRLEAMGGRVVGYVEMPERVKDVFERFEIRTPDVGESLTIKKGDKRQLSPEQYDNYRRETLTNIYNRVEKMIDSDAYRQADDEKREDLIRRAISKARNAEKKDMKRELKTN